MSKNLLGRLMATCVLTVLSVFYARAFDLKVVVTDEVTGQRTGDISLTAHDPKDLSLIGSADFVSADTTFTFRNLPDKEVLIMWPEGLDMHSASARPDMEELRIQAKIEQETQLNEVVVQGLSRYMTDDGQVYIPSKQERKSSMNATALLSMMAIPTLSINLLEGGVSTSAGETVEIFINYMAASAEEVSGLRPMEIEKVEVLDYPKDPRFNGAQHVINYILVEYLYGGFTRVFAEQNIMTVSGSYSLYSKMRYRAMTYDLSGGYGYSESRHSGNSSSEEYRLTDMTVLKSIEPEHSRIVGHFPNASFKATYQGSNSIIANTVGFSFRDTPVNRQRSVTSYTPAVVAGNWEESDAATRNMTLSWDGNWKWFLPHSYTFTVIPGVRYGHNRSDSRITGTGYDIMNDALEKNWDYNLRALLSRQFGQHLFTLQLWGRHINDAIEYSGSSASDVHTRYVHVVARLNANLRFGKFWAYGRVQGAWRRSKTNDIINFNRVSPNYQVTLGYNPTQRTQLELSSSLFFESPQTSQLTQDVFLQTPLFAITGNPYLKEGRVNEFGANCTQFLSGTFSLSGDVVYTRKSNIISEAYERSEFDGREIILRSYANMPYVDWLNYAVSLSGRFLSNTLNGTIRVGGESGSRRTTMKKRINRVKFSANINWMHNNWYLMASYQQAGKDLTTTGWQKYSSFYYIGAGWGSGDWNLTAILINPFRDSWVAVESCVDSPVFRSISTEYNWGSHQRILINASWSISYGKKIEQRVDLYAPQESTSGILH